jgi:hypothetical protein
MRNQILVSLILLLTAFVLYTSLRIEYLNVNAGYYLPRQNRNPDGTFLDGTWRISSEDSARDRLRQTVGTFGLAQYLVVPSLLGLSLFQGFKSRARWIRTIAIGCCLIGLFALTMMYYRGYYSSLGY